MFPKLQPFTFPLLVPAFLLLVPKLQLGNVIAGKAPALNRRSGASRTIYVPKLELGNEMRRSGEAGEHSLN
jgi:hypothetical protein